MVDSEVEMACRICNKIKTWKWAADWQTNNGMCSEECKTKYRSLTKCPLSIDNDHNKNSGIDYACTQNLHSCFAVDYEHCSELIKYNLYIEYLDKMSKEHEKIQKNF